MVDRPSLSTLNVNEKQKYFKKSILSNKARQHISKKWNYIDCVL